MSTDPTHHQTELIDRPGKCSRCDGGHGKQICDACEYELGRYVS